MELLLNLAWFLLVLAVPAWWLWRGPRPARVVSSLYCLLSLGCMLVVLFPVVSATDDLRAMRAEMEESQGGRRSIRLAANEKPSAWKWQHFPALAAVTSSLNVVTQGWQPLPKARVSTSVAHAIDWAGRAPPRRFFL